MLIRFLTFSCATTTAPAPRMFSLPPVWSPCQCVFSTNRMGRAVRALTAASTLGVSGAYWSSTTIAPSSPTDTPMLPPTPVSM